MIKKYKTGAIHRIFTLGFKRYGATIDNDILNIYSTDQLLYKKINIKDIKKISYLKTRIGVYYHKQIYSFVYSVETKDKDITNFSYSLFSHDALKELMNDLLSINKSIKLCEETKDIINAKKSHLKFDFTYHKGNVWRNDRKFMAVNPSLDALLGIISLVILALLPYLAYTLGNSIYENNFLLYRKITLISGGLTFGFGIINILAALCSAYLGHKVTILSFLSSIILIIIGLL